MSPAGWWTAQERDYLKVELAEQHQIAKVKNSRLKGDIIHLLVDMTGAEHTFEVVEKTADQIVDLIRRRNE